MGDPRLTVQAHIPQGLQAAVVTAVERAQEERVAQRLAQGDPSLWGGPQAPEVVDRLGWLDVARRSTASLEDLEAFADEVRDEGVEHVVLLGMGGSSLAPEVLRRSLPAPAGRPKLHVLDSTDAGAVRAIDEAVDPDRTLWVVSSKSGGTIEPLSMLAHYWRLAGERGQRFVAITDPGTSLQALARELGFRRVFHGDPHIGGRYSALSPFGIVPATLAGLDARALLADAHAAWDTGIEPVGAESLEEIHGLAAPVWLGAALSALARAGRDKLTFFVTGGLDGLGLWLEQLWAESTGKRGTGILPVAEEPPGEPGAYGEDRVFVHLDARAGGDVFSEAGDVFSEADEHAHTRARARALAERHPFIAIPVAGPLDLGRVFLLSELAVAVAGWGLGINPFDQPDVQRAKDATKAVLDRFEREGRLPDVEDSGERDSDERDPDERALRAVLAGARPPAYVAIMGYLQPSPAFDAAIGELRAAIRDATRATTTFGYGPRFLHSTGQFHKGGPRTGRFLQLVHDGRADVEIPGKPYTFDTLKNAQAIGDLQTLRELGPPTLPAERVRLRGEDPAEALRTLTTKIKELL